MSLFYEPNFLFNWDYDFLAINDFPCQYQKHFCRHQIIVTLRNSRVVFLYFLGCLFSQRQHISWTSTYILNVNIYSERQLPSLLISSRLWIVSAIFPHFSTISSLDPKELLRKATEYIPFAASSPPQSLVALFLFFSEECAFTNSLNTFIRRDSRIVTKFCNSSKLISVSCFSLASAVSASFGSLSVETFSSLSTLNEPMYSKALFVAKRYSKAVCKIRMVDDDPP